MKTIKARGLVLKEYEAGESDKRLLLLCKGIGRILVYARGARKPKSKFMAAAQLFTYADFVLAQGNGFYSVTQADVIESFYNLRTDYDRLCAAHLMAEVCEKTLLETSNCDDLLLLTLKSLTRLAKGNLSPLQITDVFLLRFFSYYGLRPVSDFCAVCDLPLGDMTDGIFFGAEGIVCAKHKENSILFSLPAAAALSFILDSELAQAFSFKADPAVLLVLQQAAKLMWDNHFEWELFSLQVR